MDAPPALGSGDVVTLQNAASANQLVIFLSQFELLSGQDPATQQAAATILNDARDVELALNTFADGAGVTLPPDITGNDQALARQMIAGVRAGHADQTYSRLIVQAGTSLVDQMQQAATNAETTPLKSLKFPPGLLRESLTLKQFLRLISPVPKDVSNQALPPVSNSPSSATLDPSDLDALETYYSINLRERFLGQLTALASPRPRMVQYASKLIGDHQSANIKLGVYAASTETYLPANISPSDVPMAQSVIAGLGLTPGPNTTPYVRNYLRQMVMGHSAALKFTHQTLASIRNPVLNQYAANVEPSVFMHRQEARGLLNNLNQ